MKRRAITTLMTAGGKFMTLLAQAKTSSHLGCVFLGITGALLWMGSLAGSRPGLNEMASAA